GNLLTVTDARGKTITRQYDGLNRLATLTYPGTTRNTVTYTYNNAGQVLTETNGSQTSFTYDARGLLRQVTYGDSTYNSYTYDLGRRLTHDLASASAVASTYIYDNRNRLTNLTRTIDAAPYTLGFTYDTVGNVLSITYPGGGATVTQVYDELNRLMTINGYANLSYDAAGNLSQMAYSNGITTSYSYNNRGLLSQISSVRTNPQTTILNLVYAYDNAGNITGINNEVYTYDGLNRLLTASKPAQSYTASYQYDAVGNRTQLVEDGVTTTYNYNAVNELTTSTGTTYTWDARGNLIGKVQGSDTWAYTFDLANRLTQVKKNNVTIGTYAYDANGIRAKKVENGATTHYLALGYKVMYEKTGAVGTHHIFAGSQRIAEVRGPTTSYFHNDHLGSPRAVTDASGVPGSSMATKPFGEPHAGSAQTSYGFTGKDLDGTGLYYFAARYYDASVGRFITEDIWVGRLSTPASQNRYVYVVNNPLKYVDPTGNIPELDHNGGGGGGIEAIIWGIAKLFEAGKKVVGEVYTTLQRTYVSLANAITHGVDKVPQETVQRSGQVHHVLS
ncbi:MAG: RHS repeat-associated core domain-containing protein, partial [Bacillota bacterium]|nr:RHS repeat-associated core domain-containing protein [Bacillota bacterium]